MREMYSLQGIVGYPRGLNFIQGAIEEKDIRGETRSNLCFRKITLASVAKDRALGHQTVWSAWCSVLPILAFVLDFSFIFKQIRNSTLYF